MSSDPTAFVSLRLLMIRMTNGNGSDWRNRKKSSENKMIYKRANFAELRLLFDVL